ncbi:FAD-dependent oxidoreductase [Agromyces protaetiae]|uniref:FAD-dependent oxidoreductase n=1 Tax=Agromyces protaetiae TaxID=2509455 RepID=UPI001FB79340|nr:FAD-dependent oxidoreductase [Agromyces protaetiae]
MTAAFRVPVGTAANPVLDRASFQRLLALGASEDVTVGDHLFSVGDTDPDFFVMEAGAVDIVREATGTSPARTVAQWQAGEFLGEMSMLTGQASLLTARISEAGRVCRVPNATFKQIMSTDGPLSDLLLGTFRARRALLMNAAGRAVEIVGRAASASSMTLRTYATRMELPHRWLDVSTDAGRAALAATGLAEDDLPVVVTQGATIAQATPRLLADAVGLRFRGGADGGDRFDLVVVGAGPAGLAAGIYGASEGLSTLVLDALAPGGQAAASSRIENYLGFPAGLSGAELTELGIVQALKFGVRISAPTGVEGLVSVTDDGADRIRIDLTGGEHVTARAVVVATGARYRRLPLDRWDDFEGGSIFFATTELEGRDCAGKPVAVVGGANSAGQAALFLADLGCTVSLIVRGDSIEVKMSSYLVDRIVAHERITVHTSTDVSALHGGDHLESISLTSSQTGATLDVDANALFCFVGAVPGTSWLTDIAVDDSGFLLTDMDVAAARAASRNAAPAAADRWEVLGRSPLPFETSIPRVFAAGDVRLGSMKRIAAATGEGASAVASVHRAIARD